MQYIDTTLITILFMIIYKFLVPSRWIKETSERVERGQKLTATVTRYNFKSSVLMTRLLGPSRGTGIIERKAY